jgi:ketosteroid isomerase-like protein
MKRLILFCALAMTLMLGTALTQERGGGGRGGFRIAGRSPGPPPAGPLVNLVQSGAEAYNKGNIAYFEQMFADDILWVDEDGHELTSKMFCVDFIRRQITATPKRTMTVTDIATGAWGDTGWAAFAYTIDDGINQRKGMNTTVFKKAGNDWKIVLIHGAINAPAVPH